MTPETTIISLRISEELKIACEKSADKEDLSLNAWARRAFTHEIESKNFQNELFEKQKDEMKLFSENKMLQYKYDTLKSLSRSLETELKHSKSIINKITEQRNSEVVYINHRISRLEDKIDKISQNNDNKENDELNSCIDELNILDERKNNLLSEIIKEAQVSDNEEANEDNDEEEEENESYTISKHELSELIEEIIDRKLNKKLADRD